MSDIEPGGIGTDRAEMDVLRHKLVAEKAINKHLKTRVEQLEAALEDYRAHHEKHHLDCEIANHEALAETEQQEQDGE